MIVTLQRKIVFENACGVLVNLEDLEKAILSDFRSPFASRHKIYIHAKYPAVSMRNDKVHIHRLLAKYWYGSENIHGMYVHHKDGNKLNCLKDNLEIISISNHQSMHNVGKTISEEQKESIRKFNRNRNGLKRRKMLVGIHYQLVHL